MHKEISSKLVFHLNTYVLGVFFSNLTNTFVQKAVLTRPVIIFRPGANENSFNINHLAYGYIAIYLLKITITSPKCPTGQRFLTNSSSLLNRSYTAAIKTKRNSFLRISTVKHDVKRIFIPKNIH